eukprot:Sspe_Gene.54751::Locus_30182_Transcript_1_1_Confidence_1.000_Length_2901::g.54751::m.54751
MGGGALYLLLLLLLALFPAVTCEEFKMAFVYPGVISDLGWTNLHNEGRIYTQERLREHNITVTSELLESVDPAKTIETFRGYSTKGFDLVVAASFTFHDEAFEAAKLLPNLDIIHIAGYYQGPMNFITAFGRVYQARYLSGLVAGGSSRNRRIGFVASLKIPEVYRNVNAFYYGAKTANPTVEVVVAWINTFYSPELEVEAARRLVALGCDVVGYHTDSREIPVFMHDQGLLSVGSNGDLRRIVGESVLVSTLFNWGPLYTDLALMSRNGSFRSVNTSRHQWYGYAQGVATTSALSFQVPRPVEDLFRKEEAKLLSNWDPFCRNVYNSTGHLMNFLGEACLTDGQLLGDMWYLVQGVADMGDVRSIDKDECPRGNRYTEDIDQVGFTFTIQCLPCEPGTFDNLNFPRSPGSKCTPCLKGSYSLGNATVCELCPEGTFAANNKSHECTPCPSGHKNFGKGNYECFKESDAAIPVYLIVIMIVVCIFFLVGIALLWWRLTSESRERARLYDNNAIAEGFARAVNKMALEDLKYLDELNTPNRIQSAFLSMFRDLSNLHPFIDPSILKMLKSQDEGVSRNPLAVPATAIKLHPDAVERTVAICTLSLSNLEESFRRPGGSALTADLYAQCLQVLVSNEVAYFASVYQIVGNTVGIAWGSFGRTGSSGQKAMDYTLHVMDELAWVKKDKEVNVVAGISYGKAFVGPLGGAGIMRYMILGPPATLSRAWCSLNHLYGSEVLIDDTVADAISKQGRYKLQRVDTVQVPSRASAMGLTVVNKGASSDWMLDNQVDVSLIERAWAKANEGNLDHALELFIEAKASDASDPLLTIVVNRLKEFMAKRRKGEPYFWVLHEAALIHPSDE